MEAHPVTDTLIRFVAGTLPQEASVDVFGHLAFCDGCRTRVLALRLIAADPDGAGDRLALHGDATGDPAAAAPARDRVPWATARVVVDAARGLAAVTLEHVGRALSGGEACRLVPVPCGAGVGDDGALGRVASGEQRVELRLEGPDFGAATVVADARRDAIAVMLNPPADPGARRQLLERRPLATLTDADGVRRHEAPLLPVEGATYLLAEFEHPDGTTWVLGLEFGE